MPITVRVRDVTDTNVYTVRCFCHSWKPTTLTKLWD